MGKGKKDKTKKTFYGSAVVMLKSCYDNDQPVAVTSTFAEADAIASAGNVIYNSIIGVSADPFQPYQVPGIQDQPDFLVNRLCKYKVPVTVIVTNNEIGAISVAEWALESIAAEGYIDEDGTAGFSIPHMWRCDDDASTVYISCLIKITDPPTKAFEFAAMVEKQIHAILKRFEKSGMTPSKLSRVKKSKILEVPHSTFQMSKLHVFTTDKNRNAWLKANGLKADD